MKPDEWKKDYKEFSDKSGNPELFSKVIREIENQMLKKGVKLTPAELLGIASHVSAMIRRGAERKQMKVENKDIFSELSNEFLNVAADICKLIPHIHKDEKYLLAIHFQHAKEEQLIEGGRQHER